MYHVWTCRCCGKQFEDLPLSYAPAAPDPWHALPDSERSARGKIDSDLCVIAGEGFFVRGCVEIPIVDLGETFVWGAWVSVSRTSWERILDLWDSEIRRGEPPIFGWLSNNLSVYPQTFGLNAHLHLRDSRQRPFIEIEPTDHPLAVEQRDGMSLRRVEEIATALMPRH
jgi:hypothetical protein